MRTFVSRDCTKTRKNFSGIPCAWRRDRHRSPSTIRKCTSSRPWLLECGVAPTASRLILPTHFSVQHFCRAHTRSSASWGLLSKGRLPCTLLDIHNIIWYRSKLRPKQNSAGYRWDEKSLQQIRIFFDVVRMRPLCCTSAVAWFCRCKAGRICGCFFCSRRNG